MIGADEAHHQNITGLSSRTIDFPDGLTRHITLKNWYWLVLDWLHDQGWSEQAIPQGALIHAQEFCKDPSQFEKEIRSSFALIMAQISYSFTEEENQIVNDNKVRV